jgi:hypothetical protein
MRRVQIKGTNQTIGFPDEMDEEQMLQVMRSQFSQPAPAGQNVSDALKPRQAYAQGYEPTLPEQIKNKIGGALYDSGIISDRYGAQRIGDNISMMAEALPVVGDAVGGDDFGRVLKQGDGVGMALGALGAIPLVGDAAKKVFKGKVFHQTNSDFDEFDFDKTSDGTVWFTDNKANFSDPNSSAGAAAGKGRIIERDVELNNVAGYDELDKYSVDELVQQGYDGAFLDGDIQVFDPKAIKSPSTDKAMSVSESLKSKYPNLSIGVRETDSNIILDKVIVPEKQKGTGTKFMNDLIADADSKGKPIGLTPSSDFGGNKKRLTEFYKRFGFIDNKGKNKDFEISESLIRPANKPINKTQSGTKFKIE